MYLFLFLIKNIHVDCGYSFESPQQVPTLTVLSKNIKIIIFSNELFIIFEGAKIAVYCMGEIFYWELSQFHTNLQTGYDYTVTTEGSLLIVLLHWKETND